MFGWFGVFFDMVEVVGVAERPGGAVKGCGVARQEEKQAA